MSPRSSLLACFLIPLAVLPALAQDLPSIEDKTSTLVKQEGFFPLYWDESDGTIWLEIAHLGQDFLYVTSLPAGLGSNDVGLDRSQLGTTRVARFERVGPKVLLVEPNLRYRAVSTSAPERESVRDAFAEGVVWGFKVAAATDGRVLVDATDFVVRDVHGIVRRLKQTGQGTYSLDGSRSAPEPSMLKSFPDNTEMEARVTFTGDNPGRRVREVAADPYALTMRVRHSFVRLPGPGYTPRPFHPGAGFGAVTYRDYASPIGESVDRRFIRRHRLIKKDPDAAVSDPVEPIIYYLDPGTPEPVRSALLQGARWWADAFEEAGFSKAFRVEMLPEGADPMDVRYNTIQWVHRATRGWSYGSSVTDPRTGEIIKGHVLLGSLRVRQDYLIAEGLLAPYNDGYEQEISESDPMLEMALARIRQLSAHEVGHTLGLSHNFSASADGRTSVMDYPAPFATVAGDGTIDLSGAYAEGIGSWDKVAIAYGYRQPPPGVNEATMLQGILADAHRRKLSYITDADARPAGAAHPRASLWDNGNDMVSALDREMRVREAALARFGESAVRSDRPLALLEEVLVPLYLHHRYQIDATAKLVAGLEYSYSLRGDGQPPPAPVDANNQRAAIAGLLQAIRPAALRLPESARRLIPPRPPGYPSHRELFGGFTGVTFDPYAPAEVVAGLVLGLLIHPERASRMLYQHDFDPDLPGLTELLEDIDDVVWKLDVPDDPYDAELQRVVQRVWTDELIDAAAEESLAPGAQATITRGLRKIQAWLRANPGDDRDEETLAHRTYVSDQINRYLTRTFTAEDRRAGIDTPPGSPIGEDTRDFERRRQQRRALLDRWDRRGEACNSAW